MFFYFPFHPHLKNNNNKRPEADMLPQTAIYNENGWLTIDRNLIPHMVKYYRQVDSASSAALQVPDFNRRNKSNEVMSKP